jgi:DNA-binding NtrC family response regulator
MENLELALLCGVLDALPVPAALLGRRGKPAYVNAEGDDLGLSGLDYPALPEVARCLEGAALSGEPRDLPGVGAGTLELYPVRSEDAVLGALFLFRPDKEPEKGVEYFDALPTVSAAMDEVWSRLRRLSVLGTVALILGERGVGKESFARALHRMSPASRYPFVPVSAAVCDERDLRQSAVSAAEGTLFVDGADELPPPLQLVLLKLLADKAEGKGLLRARVVCAALPGLEGKAQDGSFSPELYQRVKLLPVVLPPLRERPEDILPAAQAFLKRQAAALGRDLQGFAPDARAALLTNRWEGNLPALREDVRLAAEACPSGLVLASHLPGRNRGDLDQMTRQFTRERISSLMDVYGRGVEGKRAVAKELGIGLSTLYRLLAKG